MRILLSVEHPAWAHQFRALITQLQERGHVVKTLAIDKDRSVELLNKFGIEYELIASSTGSNVFQKAFYFVLTSFRIFRAAWRFKPDLFLGRASPMMALNSFLFRREHLVYDDTERCWTGIVSCLLFSDKIVTPMRFRLSLGKKHIRLPAFKELFYLHPKYFTPKPEVLAEVGVKPEEVFSVVRFVAWKASHDVGYGGYSHAAKLELIRTLEKYGRVLISSEEKLPADLAAYQIKLPVEKIHHLLYYAAVCIGEGATMASEAAMLGTHALFVSPLTAGSLDEQEERYGLVYNFSSKNRFEEARQKADQLLKNPGLREWGKSKRERLLKDTVDINSVFLSLIEQYA